MSTAVSTKTVELLQKLGYTVTETVKDDEFSFGSGFHVTHPENRKPVFLGDLVDRGPGATKILRLVMSIVETGKGFCVPGNHDMKLLKKLRGKEVKINHGFAETMEQMDREPESFHFAVRAFLDRLISHYVLDDGKLVVVHAGMKEHYQGRGSSRVRSFALYGETTGETDQFGLPIRLNWAADYRGKALVVYGHTPVHQVQWLNNTVNIDTGCVFGGDLTALRYPEKEIVQVPARKMYMEPAKPLEPEEGDRELSMQQQYDDLPDIGDLSEKMIVHTGLRNNVIVRPEQTAAALEVMSRFAIDPRWLIHLPPTMSPCETGKVEGFLEYPTEAFQYFKKEGVKEVICEEKHMGSRAIIVLCRSVEAAKERFGVLDGKSGVCYTRTGRAFFNDDDMEAHLMKRLQGVFEAAKFWDTFKTSWVCLDCELMPWSMKAQELLRQQYAAVGSASRAALPSVKDSLELAARRGLDVKRLLDETEERLKLAHRFTEAYRHYCWPVDCIDDLKLAPFHILATEGHVYTDKNHKWHMETIGKLYQHDPGILRHTRTRIVHLDDDKEIEEAVSWWLEMTGKGGEGHGGETV